MLKFFVNHETFKIKQIPQVPAPSVTDKENAMSNCSFSQNRPQRFPFSVKTILINAESQMLIQSFHQLFQKKFAPFKAKFSLKKSQKSDYTSRPFTGKTFPENRRSRHSSCDFHSVFSKACTSESARASKPFCLQNPFSRNRKGTKFRSSHRQIETPTAVCFPKKLRFKNQDSKTSLTKRSQFPSRKSCFCAVYFQGSTFQSARRIS